MKFFLALELDVREELAAGVREQVNAMLKQYDYLIVGAGLFGAVFAHEAILHGKRCLVLDKRSHIGGNIFTREVSGIQVHVYGAHIFHTDNRMVWEYMNRFGEFNRYTNSPVAIYHDELYNLPFNMNTFSKLWNIKTPLEAQAKIQSQIAALEIREPRNLEEQALRLVGTDIYEKLVKGYTEKQWGRDCKDLPAFIIRRLPVRFTFDNNYFDDRWQGIPIGGYTRMVEQMLQNADVLLNVDYFDWIEKHSDFTGRIIYTGPIDRYYDYRFGSLEYRSLRFETEELPLKNFQGNAVVNYTAREVPYTRIIEHKHFEFGTQPTTIITREYPEAWTQNSEPYYPINDEANNALYRKYAQLAQKENNVIFGGRLGSYRYYNMDQVVKVALELAQKELS